MSFPDADTRELTGLYYMPPAWHTHMYVQVRSKKSGKEKRSRWRGVGVFHLCVIVLYVYIVACHNSEIQELFEPCVRAGKIIVCTMLPMQEGASFCFAEPNKHVSYYVRCCDTELLRTAVLQMKKQPYIFRVSLHRVRACSIGYKERGIKINKKLGKKKQREANTVL